ncbi:hypothetical protein [Phenylobacterium sp.]|uniref:hypothetical protein n=1 Tax=Phenylobacterium sp. TaxID=1871053 RepID=UPI0035B4A314
MRWPLLLLILALAGCASAPEAPPPGTWALQASATAGSAIVRSDSGGEALRIACRRDPPDLWVSTGRLHGEGPVRLQVGAEPFTLAPAAEPQGLSAVAPLPDRLPAAMMGGGEITLSQGRRRLGPYPAPDAKTVAAFVIACRR